MKILVGVWRYLNIRYRNGNAFNFSVTFNVRLISEGYFVREVVGGGPECERINFVFSCKALKEVF